ncbi:hypothetical protein [Bifidobacterium callimiconis]|uniref:Uncharacterized protein n=1 Tax=Bifidobacterium callimiconis TaxID=2306973 RepID=A0A430FFN8_9BIFI|nr:hypothetical protein [Bifidobacterium callimiconis]RSX51630.1 hypothetical protein D2E23_0893 [Bifidobacterium callimiconis]
MAEIAERRGTSMTTVELKLTDEEIAYLEEPYVPSPSSASWPSTTESRGAYRLCTQGVCRDKVVAYAGPL